MGAVVDAARRVTGASGARGRGRRRLPRARRRWASGWSCRSGSTRGKTTGGASSRSTSRRAIAAGLTFRPLDETVAATLADAEPVEGVGLTPERERELLAAWWARGDTRPRRLASRDGDLRAHDPLQRHARPHRADVPRAVRLVLRDVRGRLALRAARGERHRALRRAPLLQGDGAAADGPRHRDRDRLDRRRVQRLHGQGGDRRTTSSAPPRRATSRSTSSSTCSATRASTPTRSSARRA